jgi:hypothetical protein
VSPGQDCAKLRDVFRWRRISCRLAALLGDLGLPYEEPIAKETLKYSAPYRKGASEIISRSPPPFSGAPAEHVNLFWTPEIKVNVFFAPSRR